MATMGLFEVVRHGEITVVIFTFTLRNVDEVRLQEACRELEEIAETSAPPWMVVDLSAAEYFGSSFVEALLRLWERVCSRDDARFAVGGIQQYCREALEVTRVDRLIQLFATRDEAVAALSAPR